MKSEKEKQLADVWWMVGGVGGAKSYDAEKVWSSISYSILSALTFNIFLIKDDITIQIEPLSASTSTPSGSNRRRTGAPSGSSSMTW
jgi:hypothetical protein